MRTALSAFLLVGLALGVPPALQGEQDPKATLVSGERVAPTEGGVLKSCTAASIAIDYELGTDKGHGYIKRECVTEEQEEIFLTADSVLPAHLMPGDQLLLEIEAGPGKATDPAEPTRMHHKLLKVHEHHWIDDPQRSLELNHRLATGDDGDGDATVSEQGTDLATNEYTGTRAMRVLSLIAELSDGKVCSYMGASKAAREAFSKTELAYISDTFKQSSYGKVRARDESKSESESEPSLTERACATQRSEGGRGEGCARELARLSVPACGVYICAILECHPALWPACARKA